MGGTNGERHSMGKVSRVGSVLDNWGGTRKWWGSEYNSYRSVKADFHSWFLFVQAKKDTLMTSNVCAVKRN